MIAAVAAAAAICSMSKRSRTYSKPYVPVKKKKEPITLPPIAYEGFLESALEMVDTLDVERARARTES